MVSKEVSCTISQFIYDDILDSFDTKGVFSQLSGLSSAASPRILFLCRFPSMVNTARFSRNLFVVGEDEYRNICAVVTGNQPIDIIVYGMQSRLQDNTLQLYHSGSQLRHVFLSKSLTPQVQAAITAVPGIFRFRVYTHDPPLHTELGATDRCCVSFGIAESEVRTVTDTLASIYACLSQEIACSTQQDLQRVIPLFWNMRLGDAPTFYRFRTATFLDPLAKKKAVYNALSLLESAKTVGRLILALLEVTLMKPFKLKMMDRS